MIQKIKNLIVISFTATMLTVPGLVPLGVASAACGVTGANIASGAGDSLAQNGNASNISCDSPAGTNATSSIGTLANNIVKIFSYIVGAVSIIMVIYGGFRYVTSGGDQNAVGSAKNTLIYAIIGLVIVALAQLLVHFVLNQTSAVTQ